jgi:multicomponent Na+:H+ antiporter subunit E
VPSSPNLHPEHASAAAGSPSTPTKIPRLETLIVAVALFGFWVVLSGKLDLFHLSAGALASVATAVGTSSLFALPPRLGAEGHHPLLALPMGRIARYLPYLIGQIVVSSIDVARIVLSPSMKIQPKLLRFETRLPHNIARATLANSITLTPGTVTLDVRGDEYLVHALTSTSANALEADDVTGMKARVARVFPTTAHRLPPKAES